MDLTSCIFYTGALHAPIPDPPAARERLNELFFHSDRISSGFSRELQTAGICLPALPIRVVSISPGPEAEFIMGFAEAFAETISNKLIDQLAADGIFTISAANCRVWFPQEVQKIPRLYMRHCEEL